MSYLPITIGLVIYYMWLIIYVILANNYRFGYLLHVANHASYTPLAKFELNGGKK